MSSASTADGAFAASERIDTSVTSRLVLLAGGSSDAAHRPGSILTGPHIWAAWTAPESQTLPATGRAQPALLSNHQPLDALVAPLASAAPPPTTAPAAMSEGHVAEHVQWIGAKSKAVAFGDEIFHLTFCYVGPCSEDPDNPSVINAELEIGQPGDLPSSRRQQFASYQELSPAERRAYLEWSSAGRRAADVPRAFLLQFVNSLEHAFLRDRLWSEIAIARAEVERLTDLHSKDAVFCTRARQLIAACEFLDPGFIPAPIYASAEANYRADMPFKVRHFLGWMLNDAGRFEADAALLFCLQQPRTRLELAVAQYFRELHALWCHGFPHLADTELPDQSNLPRLTMTYEPIAGDFARVWESSLPDVAALPLPASLDELFHRCAEAVFQLKQLPVGRILSNVPVLEGAVGPASDGEFQPKPGVATRLEAMVPGVEPQIIEVADLLSILFDAGPLKPNKLVPKRVADQAARILDEQGFGFEPDSRFGLPKSLRPDARVALFRTDKLPHDEPTDAYLLAQAAVVVSALGQIWFPGLEPLRLDWLEERLPYRHRFADREFRRLAATAVAVANLAKPRQFVERWARILARGKRINDLIRGFGIAFEGQRRNSQLAKHAKALSLGCEGLIDVPVLLEAASAKNLSAESVHTRLDVRVHCLQQPCEQGGRPHPTETETLVTLSTSALLEGLEASYGELLLALLDRPRTRAEFEELARTRRLSVASAADRINEWALMRFGAMAILEEEGFTITLPAAEFLAARVGPS